MGCGKQQEEHIYILLFALYEIIIYVFTHPTHTSSENYMLYGLQGECSKGSEGYHYKKRIISWKGLPNSHLLYTCSGSLFGKSSVRMWDLYFENNKNNIIYIYIYYCLRYTTLLYMCSHILRILQAKTICYMVCKENAAKEEKGTTTKSTSSAGKDGQILICCTLQWITFRVIQD